MIHAGKAVACSGLDLCRLWRLHCVSVVAGSVCTALLLDGPVPRGPPNPKSPNPLSQPPRNPIAPTHHDVPPYVHGPVPRGPPNPKSPNPLSQPPRNPKGVLVPKHHDVPPTHHFFLFFKGCTATSDGILASHLWLLQVTEFLVSQVTCPPFMHVLSPFLHIPMLHRHRIYLQNFARLLGCGVFLWNHRLLWSPTASQGLAFE